MKHSVISILLLMVVQLGFSQSTFYTVKFQSLTGKAIDMENCKGKTLIVYTVGSANDFVSVKMLKQLVAGNDSLIAIVVPIDDFTNSNIGANVKEFLTDSLPQNFIVTGVCSAKSRAVSNGHSLLKWLSNKDQNIHFDFDFNESGQALFISTKGELYANMLRCDFSAKSVKRILNTK